MASTRATAVKVRSLSAPPHAHRLIRTLWARTRANRVLPEVFGSLYAAASTKVQALSGSQPRTGRVAQLLASAIVGGAPPRRPEQVPLLCPPPNVQVTRLLTLMGASVTSSDLRQDLPRTGRTEPAPPGCPLWRLPSTPWIAGFSCRAGQELLTTVSDIDRAEDAQPEASIVQMACVMTHSAAASLLSAATIPLCCWRQRQKTLFWSSLGELLRRYANRLA